MKKNLFCLLQAICFVGLAFILGALSNRCHGQGIQTDAQGNYFRAQKEAASSAPATVESLTKSATKTEATFTTAKGEKFPVWLSKNGSAFVVRTSKKGVLYRQYMPKE